MSGAGNKRAPTYPACPQIEHETDGREELYDVLGLLLKHVTDTERTGGRALIAEERTEKAEEDLSRCCRSCPFRHLSHCPLDIHRCRCEPELDLHGASASESGASQPVQIRRTAQPVKLLI
jgi:hypothetical protein